MKKIMILMIVTMMASSIGCNGGWPRQRFFRGDACNNCATYETTPTYSGYQPEMVVPSPNFPPLPGPAATNN